MKRMLPALLQLLLVLAAVSHGRATLCNITENKTLTQCYGALGRSVSIYPLNTSFKIDMLEVFFRDKEFFRYKEKTKTSDGPCQNRCQLMKNGTLRLDHVMKSDSGIYNINAFGGDGKSTGKRNISLTIQDPVSPPALSQHCPSHGEIRASCKSTGEDPQYSWTLNNSPLDGRVAFLSDETQTVILGRNVSGSITCTASNRVSSEHTTQELLKCPGNSKNVVLLVGLGVCLLLMALLLGTCCLYKKKQKQAKTSERSSDDRCEDPQELVYCQVQVVKKKERPKKQEQDPQVTYGEVKVSGKSKAARRTPNEQADTIYSGIRT